MRQRRAAIKSDPVLYAAFRERERQRLLKYKMEQKKKAEGELFCEKLFQIILDSCLLEMKHHRL